MALDYRHRYPDQITDGDAGYPYGKAQNRAVPGDPTGTPWEKDLINDYLGFLQALLDAASLTPNEAPDQVGASQYLQAVQALISAATAPISTVVNALQTQVNRLAMICEFSFGTAVRNANQRFTLGAGVNVGGFTASDGRVTVPGAGIYEVRVSGGFDNASGVTATGIAIRLEDTVIAATGAVPIDDGAIANLSLATLVSIGSPSVQRISVTAEVNGMQAIHATTGPRLSLRRMS